MSLHWSGFVVLMTLIGGGFVSFWGPVIGAVVFFVARDVLGAYTETWLLWFGLMFMAGGDVQARRRRRHLAGLRCTGCAAARRARRRRRSRRCGGDAMALFEARHLHKRFGDRVVLEDISLAFAEGQLSGIMGPNGAGKTTCFNVLTGRYRPDRGRVLFDGEDITGLPPRAIARKGVSRSFQIMNLFDEFTRARERAAGAAGAARARLRHACATSPATARRCDSAAAVLARVGLEGKERELGQGASPTATAARSRSAWRSPPSRASCSSTSRPRASAPRRRARLAELDRASSSASLTIVVIEHDMDFLFGLADRSRSSTGAR